jgi:hypothetical protein
MSVPRAVWALQALWFFLAAAACSSQLVYRPQQPARGGWGGVTAELRGVKLGEREGIVTLWVAAPGGGQLGDATLSGLPAPPCAAASTGAVGRDWVGVTAVLVDQQESYHAGPADVSGTGHEVVLTFVAPDKLWRRDRLAVDLTITPAAPTGCLRLELTGIEGADWQGDR